MKLVALVGLLMVSSCSLYFFDDRPDEPGTGELCLGPSPGSGCSCTSTGWRCDTCGGQPTAEETCVPGDSCSYEDWEHGCSCSCREDGRWACFNETIGSHCPTGELSGFTEPYRLMSVSSAADEVGPTISGDELELVFTRRGPGGDQDLWRATRADALEELGAPIRDAMLSSSPADESDPSLSPDGLTMLFSRAGVVVASQRSIPTDPWGAATAVPALAGYGAVDFARNGLTLLASSTTPDPDLYELTRPDTASAWGPPRRLDELAGPSLARAPTMREDGLEMFFESTQHGKRAVYQVQRSARDQPWGAASELVLFSIFNSNIGDPELSADGKTLYVVSDAQGSYDVYVMHRERM